MKNKENMIIKQLYVRTAFVVAIASSLNLPLFDEAKVLKNFLPHIPTFPEIARKNGFECEEYNVTTADGYILRLFRIPGDVKRPVLLMHGILDSSDGFILRQNTSLGATMASSGYDAWVGNNRGNRYSRSHLTLDPNTDDSFWDFSFHEMGYYDLPAIIDFVLGRTGQSQVSIIGHSEGNTIFYVLGSTRPEYNEKIKVAVALAPIAHLQNTKGLSPIMIKLAPELNALAQAINYQELFGTNSDMNSLIRQVCSIPVMGYDICGTVAFAIVGIDPAQCEPGFLPTLIEHFPAGSSRKTAIHFSQVARRNQFAEFDFGSTENLKRYGTADPPLYNLTKITFDLALYSGANDYISTIEDVAILRSQLPKSTLVEYKVIDYPLWNHMDHIYGKFMPKYLFPLILELLSKYH